MTSRAVLIGLLALLAGCAGTPQQYEVKEVYVCAADQCGPAGRNYSASQMLQALYRFLQANDDKEYVVCSSDPKSRGCDSRGACHFVQGGPIPGIGCQGSGKMGETRLDADSRRVLARGMDYKTFMAVPLVCVPHDNTLTVRSVDEITLEETPHYCNWMGVGNMTATFNFAIDFVDFDRGRLGGYWQHAVAGNAVGRGTGYAVLQFTTAMPRGENWLQPVSAEPDDALPKRR